MLHLIDYLLIAGIAVLVILTIWYMRTHKSGCARCSGCQHYGSCKKHKRSVKQKRK